MTDRVRPHRQSIATVTLVVPTYDAGLAFYCGALGFSVLEDHDLGDGKRWLRVGPDNCGCGLLLAQATTVEQKAAIGKQTGGRVSFFLSTEDFEHDYAAMKAAGVHFCEEPRHETYGSVVVFEDPFGNKWDLLEMQQPT
jgi:catechol 2,3-dioxygenase-like lactoylglutathione lyase family enzyme